MIESWVQECSELAPYLKEKLAADKDHTWLTAPYIHQKVRDALAEHEPASPVYHYNPSPVYSGYCYPWTPGGGGGAFGYGGAAILPHPATQYSMMTYQNQLDALIGQQEALTRQIQQNQLNLILNMNQATRPYWDI